MIRKDRVVPFIGLALIAAIALTGCSMSLDADSSGSSPSASASPSATPDASKQKDNGVLTEDEKAALIKALTVKTVSASAECKTDGETSDGRRYVTFQIDSLLGTPPRLWPASISTAIAATDPVGARVELQQAICKDPLLGTAWLTFMATTIRDEVLATTGMDLIELNPRLKAYTDISQIKAEATAFVPLLNVMSPSASQLDAAVTKNVNWQQDAALVNTLLERFAATGIEARQSLVNYELFNYITASDLSDVRAAQDQENLPALIFAITVKGQCGEVMAFGANVGDKRPELFAAKTCAPPTTTTTTPGCTTNCGSDTPGCTSNCGGTPPCTTNCGNTPKSHDPGDYTYPTGKPPATVTTPPEATPPAVNTTQPGGGGVVDTPTKKPGTETGTTAPGATPAPTTPATPPVNQGGDNGAGDTGGF